MLLTMLNPFAAGATRVDGKTAVKMVRDENAVVVDVRDPSELTQGKVKGAINLPLGALATRADPQNPQCDPALKNGQPIILYCASGSRSGMAGKILMKLGHQKVFDMGSLSAWNQAGGKIGF